MSALHLTDLDFKTTLETAAKKKQIVFVDFFAEWCGPCKMAAPIVDKLAETYKDKVIIAKVDVDQNTVSRDYDVMSIPTVIIFKDGVEVDRKIGFPGEAGYVEMIEAAMKEA